MGHDNQLVDINQLFNHWMTQIETNEHYKELSHDELNHSSKIPKTFCHGA